MLKVLMVTARLRLDETAYPRNADLGIHETNEFENTLGDEPNGE